MYVLPIFHKISENIYYLILFDSQLAILVFFFTSCLTSTVYPGYNNVSIPQR